MEKLLDEAEFIKLLRKSKQEPINFTFGLGKSSEDNVLAFHRKKKGKSLFRMLKQEAKGITKGTWGTATSDPKSITLTIEKDIPAIYKSVKLFLKMKGIKLKPIIIGPDGKEVADDDTDDATLKTEKNGALKNQLNAVLKKLVPTVQKVLKATPERKVELMKPLEAAKKAIEKEDFDTARNAVKDLVAAIQSGAPPSGDVADGGDAKDRKVMEIWTKVKDVADTQITDLQDALRKTGDPDLREIADKYADVLRPYRTKLNIAMENYYGAPTADQDKARQAAISVMDQFASDITSDFLIEQAEANPFGVKVFIRPTFGKALTAMKKAIAS